MFCTNCQTELVDTARFCHHCGSPVVEPGDQARAASPDRASGLLPRTTPDEPERQLWEGSYSAWAMLGPCLVALGLTLAVIVAALIVGAGGAIWTWLAIVVVAIWIGLYLTLLYRQLSVRYRLTNQRLVHKAGILIRVTDRIEVIDMDDITFVQGPLERVLGIGTIRVTSSDRTHPVVWLRGIERVQFVAEIMDRARRDERVRRGIHIEAV